MTGTNDLEFRVLHALALRGMADHAGLAESTGRDEPAVVEVVAGLLAAELLRERQGRRGGFALTAQGKQRHHAELAERVDEGVTAAAERAYERFLPVNGEFKRLCTDWQLRGATAHDHTDLDYDFALIDRLYDIDERLAPALVRLARAVPLFDRYPVRLDDALKRIGEGDHDSFLKPMTGSYHDVWMELHADLLLAAGRTRGDQDE